ncbi:hypothetical protein ACIRPP_04865 [Streptomyces sp. NPDC101219]|uniref:hypothetical protein n=1 Tax=Streptomyces sp. NPDC101219 TaxID=3366131 RepID=UPI003812DA1A
MSDVSPRGLLESYVSVIRQVLSPRIEQDSRVKDVVSKWSACMKSSGYSYKTPSQAVNDERWQGDESDQVARVEIQTATADMACKRRVRYVTTVAAVESAYETRYIKQNPGRMAEFRSLREAWDHNAEQMLR